MENILRSLSDHFYRKPETTQQERRLETNHHLLIKRLSKGIASWCCGSSTTRIRAARMFHWIASLSLWTRRKAFSGKVIAIPRWMKFFPAQVRCRPKPCRWSRSSRNCSSDLFRWRKYSSGPRSLTSRNAPSTLQKRIQARNRCGLETSGTGSFPNQGCKGAMSYTGAVDASENRTARLLFKLAVEMSMMMNILAANADVDETTLGNLRRKCVQDVKRSVGSVHFEDVYRFQKARKRL
ncbi:hypothetical protein Psch_01319 [Pelotomaculum schinkii]|uniref:Uncharacterized protein n=1 Tax=Pelotomaculum schinkii TaxID=78350 RepID=A0A4Y7RFJ9_9FIRM|nr:hypothetical protein Psch_01319 [Pelotomaculum schinkii]